MAKLYCFSSLLARKKKLQGSLKALEHREVKRKRALQVKLESLVHPADEKELKETSINVHMPIETQQTDSICIMEVLGDDTSHGTDAVAEGAYVSSHEHDETLVMGRDISNFDLQARDEGKVDLPLEEPRMGRNSLDCKFVACERRTSEMTKDGHVSDPGIQEPSLFWGSPSLKRSCSNLESKAACRLLASPSKSLSYVSQEFHKSPLSVVTPCGADRLILRKQSSSQVLPSRSMKLWWKLFLRTPRNLHKPWTSVGQINPGTFNDDINPKGGFSSDTLETSHDMSWRRTKGKEAAVDCSTGDLWSQNQWLAFSAEASSIHRVYAWRDNLEDETGFLVDGGGDYEGQEGKSIVFPNSPENGESSGVNKQTENSWQLAEEVLQANNVIQSLNPLSSVAHISNSGLKVIPAMSAFSSLRVLNLASNFIVHITSGMLPKNLHILDLSKNKIAAIEGLRELTHLRVLNLISYNRISRIGHGLSDCSLIKELYLAGNKISYIEGLHRLLKLSVLDLSFNKITTSNALGQIVANYNSLLALNLLGNPIQSNFGDDQLRKAVTSLLPQLAYLNKQPTKAGRVREVTTDNIAKAALGNSGRSSRRRSAKLSSQNSGSSVRSRIGDATGRRGQLGGLGGQHSSSKKLPKDKYQSSVRK